MSKKAEFTYTQCLTSPYCKYGHLACPICECQEDSLDNTGIHYYSGTLPMDKPDFIKEGIFGMLHAPIIKFFCLHHAKEDY